MRRTPVLVLVEDKMIIIHRYYVVYEQIVFSHKMLMHRKKMYSKTGLKNRREIGRGVAKERSLLTSHLRVS